MRFFREKKEFFVKIFQDGALGWSRVGKAATGLRFCYWKLGCEQHKILVKRQLGRFLKKMKEWA